METRSIKDFIHLYLGCEIEVSGQKEILDVVSQTGEFESLFRGNLRNYYDVSINPKPILRPLSDMTEDELTEYGNLSFPEMNGEFDRRGLRETVSHIYYEPEVFIFLLSKHFDVFGLIDAGLAIDKTNLKE